MIWKASYITDIGTRDVNQDSLMIRIADTQKGQMAIAAVADGMGGLQDGELASKQVVLHLARWFENVFPRRVKQNPDGEFLERELVRILVNEEKRLVEYAQEKNEMLGTTLTTVVMIENYYYMIHVGDSRCYLLNRETTEQLSEDHTFLAQEVRRGRMTLEESKRDKRKNILTECIGVNEGFHYQYRNGNIHSGDAILLCSDGFWHHLEKADLESISDRNTWEGDESLEQKLQALVSKIKERGEKDNITAVVLYAAEE